MIYVSDTPWLTADGPRFNLWADTSDEAFTAAAALGALGQLRTECNAWEAYAIAPEQLADAIALGITVTDRFGPAEWCARRDGRPAILAAISVARLVSTRGCT